MSLTERLASAFVTTWSSFVREPAYTSDLEPIDEGWSTIGPLAEDLPVEDIDVKGSPDETGTEDEQSESGWVYVAQDALEKVCLNWSQGVDSVSQSHLPSGLEVVIAVSDN